MRTTRCGESAGGWRRSDSCGARTDNGAHRRSAVRMDDDRVAGLRRDIGRQIVGDKGLRPADRVELHRNEPPGIRCVRRSS